MRCRPLGERDEPEKADVDQGDDREQAEPRGKPGANADPAGGKRNGHEAASQHDCQHAELRPTETTDHETTSFRVGRPIQPPRVSFVIDRFARRKRRVEESRTQGTPDCNPWNRRALEAAASLLGCTGDCRTVISGTGGPLSGILGVVNHTEDDDSLRLYRVEK